jgi:hypothetical protein
MPDTNVSKSARIILDQALELEGMMFERTKLKATAKDQNTLPLDKRINELASNIHDNIYALSKEDYQALDRLLKENNDQFSSFSTENPMEELKQLGREALIRGVELQNELLKPPELPDEKRARGMQVN